MKILSVGNFTSGWDGSICDEEHIASALEDMGHQVYRWQRGEDVDIPVTNFDFALVQQWDGYPDHFIDNLRTRNGCPVVYWAFDYQKQDQEWHKKLIECADLYLSKRIADSIYPNWQWFSQDFAPAFLDKADGQHNQTIDVLFTGTYLDYASHRNEILKAVDDQFNLVIRSVTPDAWIAQGFKNVFGPVVDDGLPELIASARVNLSVDAYNEAGYWSDRNAQIMACGGLVMYHYAPMSEIVFQDHVIYFDNKEDCVYRLRQILERPDEDLWQVAEGGYEYAQEYLKVGNKAKQLIRAVEAIL